MTRTGSQYKNRTEQKTMLVELPVFWVTFIGFSGLSCSMAYRVPQIHKLWKRRSGADISHWMLHIQSLSYIIYVFYGILIYDWVYIISSVVSLLQNFMILGMAIYFDRQTHQQDNQHPVELVEIVAVK